MATMTKVRYGDTGTKLKSWQALALLLAFAGACSSVEAVDELTESTMVQTTSARQVEALDGVLKNDDEDGQQKLATTRSNIGEALEKKEKKHEQEIASMVASMNSMKKKHKQELQAIRNEATSSFELGEGQMVDDGSSSVLAAAMSSVQTADSDLKIKIKKAILEANAKNSALQKLLLQGQVSATMNSSSTNDAARGSIERTKQKLISEEKAAKTALKAQCPAAMESISNNASDVTTTASNIGKHPESKENDKCPDDKPYCRCPFSDNCKRGCPFTDDWKLHKQCKGSCNQTLGWAPQDSRGVPGKWVKCPHANCTSKPRPDSFGSYAAERPAVQYTVNHPLCPDQCVAKNATESSEDVLVDAASKHTTGQSAGSPSWVTPSVCAGGQHTCALQDQGEVHCWGWDKYKQVSGVPAGVKFASVSCGYSHTCGVEAGDAGKVRCWGNDGYKQASGVPAGVKFASVSCGTSHTCGLEAGDAGKVRCWGRNNYKQASKGVPAGVKFASVSCGWYHTCGVEAGDTGKVRCWGSDTSKQVSGVPAGVKFASVSCSSSHTCGVEAGDAGKVRCWGEDRNKQASKGVPAGVKFASVSCGSMHTCGLEAGDAGKVHCWGNDNKKKVSGVPAGVKFASVSCGAYHTCGLEAGDAGKVRCWGTDSYQQAAVGLRLMGGLNLLSERSCGLQHRELTGPASCTLCRDDDYHTIIDPKRNAGTCTERECPFCKPSICCGEGHKHYVVNTESLEGVCVRHTDDCTPVCVPRGEGEPWRRRVCSKGCHMMAKVTKADGGVAMGTAEGNCKAEAEKFLLVVCQADKRIVCEPFQNSTQRSEATCAQKKEVNAVAVCDFCTDLWNLGGTCIKNHMDGLDLPNCPKGTSDAKNKAIADAIKMINGKQDDQAASMKLTRRRRGRPPPPTPPPTPTPKPMCRLPTEAEQNHCTKLAMSF